MVICLRQSMLMVSATSSNESLPSFRQKARPKPTQAPPPSFPPWHTRRATGGAYVPLLVCTSSPELENQQECVNYPAIGYSCALQSCDPNPCREGEECAVQESSPPVVVCYPGGEDDECEGRCGEFQVSGLGWVGRDRDRDGWGAACGLGGEGPPSFWGFRGGLCCVVAGPTRPRGRPGRATATGMSAQGGAGLARTGHIIDHSVCFILRRTRLKNIV